MFARIRNKNYIYNMLGESRISYLKPIKREISIEHTGSAIIQPYICIRPDDIITPILPNVSANMCRNTPVNSEK